MKSATDAREWAWEEFGDTDLGDRRRVSRLVDMAAGLAQRPGGRISDVYVRPGESQGAYDFVRNDAVSPAALVRAVATATARRCAQYERIIVPIDGSSLTLTDLQEAKGFGRIGAPVKSAQSSARGLKTMEVAAVGSDGVFLGLLDVQWWTRGATIVKHIYRPVSQRETQRWIEAIPRALNVLDAEAPATRACFVLDREADSRHVLKALQDSGHEFIVRNAWDRRLVGTKHGLRKQVRRARAVGRYTVDLPRTGTRPARRANFEIRVARVTIWERGRSTDNPLRMQLNVVEVREFRTRARHPLCWTLLTNRPVESLEQARAVAQDYALRWRIEEFNRTWKSGHCNVEQNQLRHRDHVIRWAMIHAAVAARVERLRSLARGESDVSAIREFSRAELRALILVRHRYMRSHELTNVDAITVRQAVTWIAELGGFIDGARRMPGATTLGRGLERLAHYVEAFDIAFSALRKTGRMR